MLVGLVDPGRDVAERGARRIDDDDGQANLCSQFRAGLIGQQRDSPALPGCLGESSTVAGCAWHADEQVPRLHFAGAEGYAGDFDGVKASNTVQPELTDKTGEGSG